MFCNKCGNQIREGEQFCSKCGTPVKSNMQAKTSQQVTQGIPPMLSVYDPNAGQPKQKAASASEKAKEAVSKVLTAATNGARGAVGKGTAGKKPVIVGLIAVAVIALLVVPNGARINNILHKTFSSPAKYYQYVEKKTVKELASNAGEWYDSYVLDALNVYDKSVTGEIEAEIGKDGRELLGLLGLAGVDLSWLQSASVSTQTTVKDDVMAVDAAFRLNKENVFSGNMIMNTKEETAYVQIPEINEKYLGMKSGMLGYRGGYQEFYEKREFIEKLRKACPNQAKAEKLARRYMKVALKCVDNVSLSNSAIWAADIEQKCTVLKVTIDSEASAEIAKAVLTAAKDDKQLRAIAADVLRADDENMSEEEAINRFQKELEEMQLLLDHGFYVLPNMTMLVYVDGKGVIRGRRLNLDDMTFEWMMLEKGSKCGCELLAQMGSTKIKLTGNGKKRGNRISGDFNISYNSASILELTVKKMNIKDMKKGQLNGSVVAKMSSKISSIIGYVPELSAIENLQLAMDFKSSKNSHACKLGIIYDDQDVGNLSLSVKTGSGSKKALPAAKNVVMIEDQADIVEWAESVNANKLISSLKAAGLPSDMTDELEAASDSWKTADVDGLMRLIYYWF